MIKTSSKSNVTRILAGTLAATVLSLGAISSTAAAQTGFAERRPPRPQPAAKAPIVSSAFVGAGLCALVIFAGLMPVKRGHQD